MKQGLRYFQIDTDRYQDRKVKKLKKAFGCAGLAIYDYVLCEVYRVDGCGLVWDNDTAFDVAEYLGVKESLVQEIVKYCGVVGLFDATLLSGGIITSAAIQHRFLEICKRSRRTSYNIPEEWAIITEDIPKTPTEMGELPSFSQKLPSDAEVTQQKSQKLPTKIKEKKIKEKESKVKESMCEGAHTHTLAHEDERFDIFQKFCVWCQYEAPLSLQFKEPLSFENFLWLRDRYSTDLIKRCAKELHNKEAYTKNRNAFYTWQSWIAKLR